MSSGMRVEPTNSNTQKNANYGSAQTDTDIWDPAADKKVALYGVIFSTDTAGNFFLEIKSTSTKICPAIYVPANGTVSFGSGSRPFWVGAVDNVITITSSMAGNHSIILWGEEF